MDCTDRITADACSQKQIKIDFTLKYGKIVCSYFYKYTVIENRQIR